MQTSIKNFFRKLLSFHVAHCGVFIDVSEPKFEEDIFLVKIYIFGIPITAYSSVGFIQKTLNEARRTYENREKIAEEIEDKAINAKSF